LILIDKQDSPVAHAEAPKALDLLKLSNVPLAGLSQPNYGLMNASGRLTI